LAIASSAAAMRHLLISSAYDLIILSDHKNLKQFKKFMLLKIRHRNWSDSLSQLNYKVVYIAGSLNSEADSLTRYSNKERGKNMEEISLFENETHIASILGIKEAHEECIHRGIKETRRRYKMKDLNANESKLRKYIQECDICQRYKFTSKRRCQPFFPIEPCLTYGKRLSIDITGPIKTIKTNFYSVVVVDRATSTSWTKYSRNCPNTRTILLFLEELIRERQWTPTEIIRDQGVQFCSCEWRNWCLDNHIKTTKTSTYHPECNDITERRIREIKPKTSIIVKYRRGKNGRITRTGN
jgi:transposase InsO family protein